jgi:ceramide glucosyltransferase
VSAAWQLGLGMLLLGWASVVALVSGVAVVRACWRRSGASESRRLEGRSRGSIGALPPDATRAVAPTPMRVVVVRPCAGLEPALSRALASTAALRHDGPLRVVFSTSTLDDPARPVLLAAAASLRARGMDVAVEVVAPRGPNLKASQLDGILHAADDDIALVIDSDVELPALDLVRLLAPFREPCGRVAAVWCPPVEREPAGLGDRMSAALLGGSLHAFALLGTLDSAGLVGKTFAVRLPALRDAGGFGELVRYLGEDMELARRLLARGFESVMSDVVVASLASRRSVAQVLARYARWLLVIRAQRPLLLACYPLLLVATPGLVALGSIGLASGVPGSGLAVGLAVLARLVVATTAARVAERDPSLFAALRDAVLADALLLAAFVRALGPARVRWRDRPLRLGAHGILEGAELTSNPS